MVDTVNHLARALISVHGADALKFAEHAADNVRKLGMQGKLDRWNLVIAEIKKIKKID